LPVSRIAQQQQHLFNRITAISGTTQTVLRDRFDEDRLARHAGPLNAQLPWCAHSHFVVRVLTGDFSGQQNIPRGGLLTASRQQCGGGKQQAAPARQAASW
ncbi:MAG: hypothetical protein ACI9LD_000283, partial [Polaromonas sp.]